MVQKYPAVGEIVQWLPDTNEDWQFGRIVDVFHDETSKLARFVTECLPVKYTRGNVSSYKVGHVVVSPDLDSGPTGEHVVIPVEAFFTDKKDVANFWVARVWDNVPIESRIIAISKRFDSNFSILRKHEPQTIFKLKEAIEHIQNVSQTVLPAHWNTLHFIGEPYSEIQKVKGYKWKPESAIGLFTDAGIVVHWKGIKPALILDASSEEYVYVADKILTDASILHKISRYRTHHKRADSVAKIIINLNSF